MIREAASSMAGSRPIPGPTTTQVNLESHDLHRRTQLTIAARSLVPDDCPGRPEHIGTRQICVVQLSFPKGRASSRGDSTTVQRLIRLPQALSRPQGNSRDTLRSSAAIGLRRLGHVWVYDELGAVAFDDRRGARGAKYVREVSAPAEGAHGCKEGGSCVLGTATDHCYLARLALVF